MPLPDDGPGVPESLFVVPDVLVRFDHARGVAETAARRRRPELAGVLAGPSAGPGHGAGAGPLERAAADRDEHLRRVERAQEHIREGDVFQVVIAQRASGRPPRRPSSSTGRSAASTRRRTSSCSSSTDLALVGSSPETVVKCDGRRAELNPIAGTIAPGEGDAEALLSSEKDRAEHMMLVDLGRNDLSRVCVPGTVRVERFMEPERYSHVTHLVSEVVGELRGRRHAVRAAARVLPGRHRLGRAEGARDADHLGARGLPARDLRRRRRLRLPGGRRDSTRASRSARSVLRDGVAHLQAGGGIVADSDPAAEHEECLEQAAALETAIELAEAEQDA